MLSNEPKPRSLSAEEFGTSFFPKVRTSSRRSVALFSRRVYCGFSGAAARREPFVVWRLGFMRGAFVMGWKKQCALLLFVKKASSARVWSGRTLRGRTLPLLCYSPTASVQWLKCEAVVPKARV